MSGNMLLQSGHE